jgi:hypothetical protein
MRTGSSCRLSGPREANAGRAEVRNRVIAGDGDRTGGVLTSPVRSRDFEGLTGAPAWSNCARLAIIVIGLSEQ